MLTYLNFGCFYLNQLLTIHQISLLGTLQSMKNKNNCIELKIHTWKEILFSVRGNWFSVRGNWFSVRGNWFSVRENWFSVRGNWLSVRGNWILVRGNWFSVRTNWFSVGGNWFSVIGNWISFGGNWISFGGNWISFGGNWFSFRGNKTCKWYSFWKIKMMYWIGRKIRNERESESEYTHSVLYGISNKFFLHL